MWTELMNSIKKKLAWFSGAIEKVKNGWVQLRISFLLVVMTKNQKHWQRDRLTYQRL
jgi:hypothetical protein